MTFDPRLTDYINSNLYYTIAKATDPNLLSEHSSDEARASNHIALTAYVIERLHSYSIGKQVGHQLFASVAEHF